VYFKIYFSVATSLVVNTSTNYNLLSGKISVQSVHLSRNPGNIREFDSCWGNVTKLNKKSGKCQPKKSCHIKLFISSIIFIFIFLYYITFDISFACIFHTNQL